MIKYFPFSMNAFRSVLFVFSIAFTFYSSKGNSIALPVVAGDDMVVTVARLVDYNGEDVSCVGACNGVVIANVTGGLPPYSYLWEDGQTNQVAIGLCSGTHMVTVTDITGTCISTGSITLNDPPALIASATPFSFPGGFNISCFGENDGQITAIASGGVGGYSYIWSDGQLGTAALNLPSGNYFVQVTDANGCTDLDSVVMIEPAPLSANSSTILPVSCQGRSDGSISLLMTGGSGSYSYAWSDGPTGPVRTGLTIGNYSVIVQDILGCTFDTTINIGTAAVLQAGIAALLPESCEGYSDGAVDVMVNGGTLPYSYRWNNGLSTQDITGLSASDYLLTVRDNRGCTITLPVSIPPASTMTVSALQVNPACNANDGAIHLQLAGHSGPLNYLWSDGQTSASAIGLTAGTYDVVIMDEDCMISRSYDLDNSSSLEVDIDDSETACNAATGTATAIATGGNTPYSWVWSNGQTTQTANTLDVGTYSVKVTDANGCLATRRTSIEENKDLMVGVSIVPPSVCGANNASVSLSPTAGTPPYSYTWSTGTGGSSISGLRTGLYSVRVTDLNSCVDTLRIAITDDDLLVTISDDPSFCGVASASATASVSGGSAPFRYLWSSGDTAIAITGKAPGTYILQVRDEAGCVTVQSIELLGSTGVLAEADVAGISCESLQDGAIDLTILAGIPSIFTSWSDGPVVPDRTDLSPGIYEVEIQDAANCIAAGPIAVGDGCDQPLDAVDDFVQAIEGQNQTIDILLNDSYPDRDDIVVAIVNPPIWGIANLNPDGTVTYTAPDNFTGSDSFSYSICTGFGLCDVAWVYITVLPQFQIPDAFSPNGDGVNDFFDIRGISEYPNNQVTIVNRWGTEVFRASGYTGGWQGNTEGGNPLPVGTYYYRIDLGDGSEILGGYLVINR